jgi:predicted RNA-binding protein
MIVYISGGISNVPDYLQRFTAAENELKKKFPEAVILNPCRQPQGLTWEAYMTMAAVDVAIADMVYFLRNWRESKGARMEMNLALKYAKDILFEAQK